MVHGAGTCLSRDKSVDSSRRNDRDRIAYNYGQEDSPSSDEKPDASEDDGDAVKVIWEQKKGKRNQYLAMKSGLCDHPAQAEGRQNGHEQIPMESFFKFTPGERKERENQRRRTVLKRISLNVERSIPFAQEGRR